MRIITTHLGADFDALGAVAGMLLLAPKSRVVFPGSQEAAVRRFIANEKITLPEIRIRELRRTKITEAIVVDCASLRRLGEVGELIVSAGCPVRVIDHHPESADAIAGAEIITAAVAATCTVLVQQLQESGIEPDVLTASLLLMGIYEDTGGLVYADTTPADITAAAWLLQRGGRLDWVRRYVLRPLEPEQLDLLNQLVEGAVEHRLSGVRVVVSVARPGEHVEEAAYVIHRFAEIFDLPVVIALLEAPPQLIVIARSTEKSLDAGRLLTPFGGGGHATAAAARLRGRTAVEVTENLLKVVAAALAERTTAAHLATPFIHSCAANSSVAEAKERIVRLRINAMPVEEEGRLTGVVTRQILDAAIASGMGERPVKQTMRPGVPEVSGDASLDEVQRHFIEGHARFVVVRLPQGSGIITRMDLFRRLYERQLVDGARVDRRVQGARLVVHDVGNRLRKAVGEELLGYLILIGEIAKETGMSAFLVGGAVRDVLLGRRPEDVDVVVEGNGIELAQKLAERCGGHVHHHEPFLTAVVHFHGGIGMDIATARTEFYRSPAALPEVEKSVLRQDLYRRDFSINAMAISLAPHGFGDLLDFFGGQRDLAHRQIRVLHSLSFLDDPTRVIRAVRFASRLDFVIAPETRHLVQVAVQEGVFARLTGERLRDELALLLNDGSPSQALEQLEDLGVFSVVFPGINWSPALRRLLHDVEAVMAWAKLEEVETEEIWLAYLTAITTRAQEGVGAAVARRLALAGRAVEVVSNAHVWVEQLLSVFAKSKARPSELVSGLERYDHLVALVAMAVASEDKKRLFRQALTTWLRIPQPVTGAMLRAAGVPQGIWLGEAMRQTRAAVLDGKIGREEALEFAIKVATGRESAK